MRLLILRPEPGASETAARARRLGLDPVVAPLFEVKAVPGEALDPGGFEAVLLTSANGARHAPAGFTHLPCFAVGEATAAAARAAGFQAVTAGPSDAVAAAGMMAARGVRRAIHLCGRDRRSPRVAGLELVPHVVYASEASGTIPAACLSEPLVAMLHSPRAAERLARLVEARGRIALAAISATAAAAAGDGWAAKAVAREPREAALLELAAKLCNHGPEEARNGRDGA